MIRVTPAPQGQLLLQPDDDRPALTARPEELAALIADLLALTADVDDAASWDAYAALCGNPDTRQQAA